MIFLVRFLDFISLDKTKAIYNHFPKDKVVPLLVLICRTEGECETKISCIHCGQKLWIRDADVGKKGKCSNCKDSFTLRSQETIIRDQLKISDSIPINRIIQGNQELCRNALSSFIGESAALIKSSSEKINPEVLKQTTARVEIQAEDFGNPQNL